MNAKSLRNGWLRLLDDARQHLAHPDALLHLAVVGLLTGLAAGGVIVLFRLAVESTQGLFLPGGGPENYEGLSWQWRFLLPLAGGLLIGWLFRWNKGEDNVLGVTKVLERMAYHQGRLSWRSLILQFVGAAVAIISGHSVGREGPNVYLGAASGSLLGQHLTLPNNAIRTLVACGSAAGIAASFNTPLAGVIFSLEVIMLEYSVASIIPVILAAASATALSNAVFGSQSAFHATVEVGPLTEMPLVLLLGLAAGTVSALFNQLAESTALSSQSLPFWLRTSLAGLLLGVFGVLVPQVMGIGYDTVNAALNGSLAISVLFIILTAKILATSTAVGLGIPGGMIGPVLFMGAMLGGMVGMLGEYPMFNDLASNPAFYVLIGMGAMMELSHHPDIIMPGMLAIVVAGLVSKRLFKKDSLFIAMLRANGMDYDTNPVLQVMRRAGVASKMSRSFARANRLLDRTQALLLLKGEPDWIIIDDDQEIEFLMPAVDLARYVEETEADTIDLSKIPAQRYQMAAIYLQATLQEAKEKLEQSGADAIYVEQPTSPGSRRIRGVLTRNQIESAYRL
jgi:CIC family chloride channel protein